MSTRPDLDVSIEELTDIYNSRLECSIGTESCVFLASWISDGCCPNCQASSPGRLVCYGCKSSIQQGRSMSHHVCNYHGKGADFFKEFRQL